MCDLAVRSRAANGTMIRSIGLPLVLMIAQAASASEILKGLENLTLVHAAAQILEFRKGLGSVPEFDGPSIDPWGTPYRIDVPAGVIVGAGADRTFDEKSWATNEQFDGLDGDVVYRDGRVFRSNRNWIYASLTEEQKRGPELATLRTAEVMVMMLRAPRMRELFAVQTTRLAMRELALMMERYKATHGGFAPLSGATDPGANVVSELKGNRHALKDAWGTPLRVLLDGDSYRIINAGADRTFDPMSWQRDIGVDSAEDMILADGVFLRELDDRAFFNEEEPSFQPVAQPPDRVWSERDASKFVRVGKEVKAPVVIHRVEPEYAEAYRRLRLSGIVILECEVDSSGNVGEIFILKSLAPDFDTASVDAVRQWKFTPGTRDGKPIDVLFSLTINFKLK
jgi:TonB family protein